MKQLYFLSLSLFFLGCPDEGVQPQINPLELRVEDATCTEVFLKISLAASESNRSVTLRRGDSTIFSDLLLSTSDTLVVDEGLLPNKTYIYSLIQNEWKATTQATTMDTTSHNWSWEIATLGDGNGSSLYDIAIINDTLAFAVGDIYSRNDSTNDFDRYNLAVWNGQQWKLQRLLYQGYAPVVNTVFAIKDNDVWFDPWFHWDGKSFQEVPFDQMFNGVKPNKMWGDTTVGLYCVGNDGFIAHRSPNGTWRKIENGTTLHFYDIYGYNDLKRKESEILIIGGQNFPSDKIMLKLKNNVAFQQSLHPIQFESYGIWFIPERHYYLVGDGIYEKYSLSDSVWNNQPRDITNFHTGGIDGNDLNDLFVVGSYGECLHFNGNTWKSFKNSNTEINGVYGEVDIDGNLVITVGFENNKACIAVGKR